jgi:hypothetical protein
MKARMVNHNHSHVTDHLRKLPRKMLGIHGIDNVTEFVLHELCGKSCFNMKKAAYFIDNPDFNCLKGVVGVSYDEIHAIGDIWSKPKEFSHHMNQSLFNQQVRSFSSFSNKKRTDSYDHIIENLAHDLGFDKYTLYSWEMKHNNHGFLLGENDDEETEHGPINEDIVLDGLSLLSFCPVH